VNGRFFWVVGRDSVVGSAVKKTFSLDGTGRERSTLSSTPE